jgi:cytochrome c553
LAALVVALRATAAEPAAFFVPDTMTQRMQACAPCHGKEGQATAYGYYPRIAGKPAGYLYNQLVAFRDGRRNNGNMAYLLAHLSDSYLHEIADYFAALDLPYASPPPVAAAPHVLERGESLVRHGDARSRIPACTQCHGAAMTGIAPAVPALLGLPGSYLTAQLGAWRNGVRKASPPDCMADIARKLSADDIGAIAAWLAAQPAPTSSRPAVAPPAHLPLPCGSMQP